MWDFTFQSTVFWGSACAAAVVVLRYWSFWLQPKSKIPRIGPKPGGFESNGAFYSNSLQMVQEGYARYKDSVYSLWTTEMDRLIVSSKFMSELNKLPRSVMRLTTSERYAYTGMDVCEESNLQYELCAGPLTRNLGHLSQPAYDEILFVLNEKLKAAECKDGNCSIPLFSSVVDLITASTARAFVGTDLCRNPEWLATATDYTLNTSKAGEELNTYPHILWPVLPYFLKSYRELRRSFDIANRLLLPLFEKRRMERGSAHQDMVQWLLDSAKGRDAEPDRLVKRMLFLNLAAIFSTATAATNVILDLCARPECTQLLREETMQAIQDDGGIKASTLMKLKIMDSFMKESRRVNPLGLLTFQRHLTVPFTLSNGTTLPRNSYLSISYYPSTRDPSIYPSPDTFNPLRFHELRQSPGEGDKHQFASVEPHDPLWAFGKFACPGRHWATAQIKLLLIVLLLEFEVNYPDGQTERPENKVVGAKCVPSMTQKIVLRRRI